MRMKIKTLFFFVILFSGFALGKADDYIVLNKTSKVYDQPNAKYVTENQNGDEVEAISGMVFKYTEHTPGWYKIEYSPGLHAFIPEQIIADNLSQPTPGTYNIANNPDESVFITDNGEWICKTENNSLKGIEKENIVLFLNNQDIITYSLVNLDNGPIVINYDNEVTKFF